MKGVMSDDQGSIINFLRNHIRESMVVGKFRLNSQPFKKGVLWVVIFWPFVATSLNLRWEVMIVGIMLMSVAIFFTYHLRIIAPSGESMCAPELPRMLQVFIIFCLFLFSQPLYVDMSISVALFIACSFIATFYLYTYLPSIYNSQNYADHFLTVLYVFELFIIINLVFSFFLGIGEHYSYRSGNVRAFGALSDSIAPIIGFFVIKNALEYRWLRGFFAAFALAITGGKIAIGITIIAIFGLLIVHRNLWRSVFLGLALMLVSQIMLHLSFAMELPPNKHLNPERFITSQSNTSASELSSKVTAFFNAFDDDKPSHDTYTSSLDSSGEEVVVDMVQSGSRRIMSIIAGLIIAQENPVAGVGFWRSGERIQEIAESDPLELGRLLSDERVAWSKVHAVQNAPIRILAETGIVGLFLFCLFCLSMLAVFFKYLRAIHRAGVDSSKNIGIAMSVWGIVFIIFNQTVAWMNPGHFQLIWLLLCAGSVIWFSGSKKGKVK